VSCVFRRPSGIYFARLVVPFRLRQLIGKTEFVATTGTRDLALAKIISGELVASWRRQLRAVSGLASMDLVQVSIGAPVLQGDGLLPIATAAAASGFEVDDLLRLAADGRMSLFLAPSGVSGYLLPIDVLDRDPESGGYDVPPAKQMPETAVATVQPGVLRISGSDRRVVHEELTHGRECTLMLFELAGRPGLVFAPGGGIRLTSDLLQVSAREVELERGRLASRITPEQLDVARAVERRPASTKQQAQKRCSEAIRQYMAERSLKCKADQTRRIQAACELFSELTGNPRLCDVDRHFLRKYRDELLPKVPAHENKIRLQKSTTSVKDSIAAIEGTDWPRISESERTKRMQWLAGMFEWLARERWIDHDPAVGLGAAIRRRDSEPDHAKRDQFTKEDLQKIFAASWFRIGRGELTKAGTYREFLPYYYWLPLLGLYTGARINELCQLALSDLKLSSSGVWFLDINEDDVQKKKKVKNRQSRRLIPMHAELVRLGLPEWRNRLEAEGHTRLFPELPHDDVKGYSKAAVKWFSAFLARLGWERNGRKVFHSFRHTLASYCLNRLKLSEALTAQISGHQRSTSVLGTTYRKDEPPPEVITSFSRVEFQLPAIAAFDIDQGVAALQDALRRKRNRTD